MNEFPDDFTLAETVSGAWRKLGLGVRAGTMLLQMSEHVLLSVHVSSKRLDILLKDKQDIFQYAGDLAFEDLEEHGKLLFHSLCIEHIHLNDQNVWLNNTDNELNRLFIKLSLDKRKETDSKLLDK